MKKEHWKSNIAFYSVIIVYLTVTFWLLWPYEPITINSIDIMNEDNIAYVGEDLNFSVSYSKDKSYPVVELTVQLIDGSGSIFVLSGIEHGRVPVGDGKVIVSVEIPHDVNPSVFMVYLTVEYKVNPLRTVTVNGRSKPLTIKEKRLR